MEAFSSHDRVSTEEYQRLRSKATALEELLEIHERAVLNQSRRLEKTLSELSRARDELEIRIQERTEELAGANRDLERRNEELNEFTFMASHDLKEPLRKLVAYCGLLRDDLGVELPEEAHRDLFFIVDAAARMERLIEDLLSLSRIGRKELELQRVSPAACAELALEALAVAIQESGAEISRERLADVWGDPTTLTQIYQNLIGNALKFVDGGQPMVQLTGEALEDTVILGVRDRGIGIDPKYAEQVFLPFKRLHGRSEFAGTGMGLAICRKAVERQRGRIWVESDQGKGAHFRFSLDRVKDPESAIESSGGDHGEA